MLTEKQQMAHREIFDFQPPAWERLNLYEVANTGVEFDRSDLRSRALRGLGQGGGGDRKRRGRCISDSIPWING
jgi:hypothetical protein